MTKRAAPGVHEPAPGASGADEQEATEISSFIRSHCPSANSVPSSTLTSENKAMDNAWSTRPSGLQHQERGGEPGLGGKAGSPLKECCPPQRRPKPQT